MTHLPVIDKDMKNVILIFQNHKPHDLNNFSKFQMHTKPFCIIT